MQNCLWPFRQALRVSASAERDGVRKLVTRCLSLKTGEVLAIFGDETSTDVVETISTEAHALGIRVVTRMIPVAEQIRQSQADPLDVPLEDRELISGARAVLTCLAAEPRATAFRAQLVKTATDHTRRVGHMPGATLDLLRTALNIDYDQAHASCAEIALPLLKGESAALTTYRLGRLGRPVEECTLECGLGGFERPPITSTGEIPPGTWGNLPGGETFIAPVEGTAQGAFLLSGSFRGHVMQKGEALRLEFRDGLLRDVRGPGAAVDAFFSLVYADGARGDDSLNALAELGVGINPRIATLSGVSLLDEKCLGTAHIAIGHNADYGGLLTSRIHEDFVTLGPSLVVDGKPILDRGKLVASRRDWMVPLSGIRPRRELMLPSTTVRRTGVVTTLRNGTGVEVRREVAAGRSCSYSIGDEQDLPTFSAVLELLPHVPRKIQVGDLCALSEGKGIPAVVLRAALTLLLEHRVVAVHAAPEER